ncbi:MAG: DUF2608 domain-containing protein [Candidatus Babeliales bacterium]|nr:DUF2608 domain-containing protein [Candidatus Babeliales bacterium]
MNFKFYTLIITLNIFAFASCYTQMIHEFQDSLSELNRANEDTLVVFDIDRTLIIPKDPAFDCLTYIDQAIQNYYKTKRAINNYSKAYKAALYHEHVLMEDYIPQILESLQMKNVKTIALTSVGTQRDNLIPDMGVLRFNQLNKLGINFNRKFEWLDLTLNRLPKVSKTYPEFSYGILMTNYIEKGVVLIELLKLLNWIPKRVIFFDDLLHNIMSVEEHLRQYSKTTKTDIEFIGYNYIRAEMLDRRIDQKIIKLQINFLLKKGIWISADQF